jgi:hypothetical protein
MRYIVDLRAKQVDRVNRFIDDGRYNNLAQFIETAIENQIYIEESGLQLQGDTRTDDENSNTSDLDFITQYSLKLMLNSPQETPIPDFGDLSYSLKEPEEGMAWIWGQTNKLFPVKVGVRVLYSLLDDGQWYSFDEFAKEASDFASVLGRHLRSYEDRKGKLRTEKISHGLPSGDEEKSRLRYRSHFLANIRGDGKLDGAMCFYRFANIMTDEKGRVLIGITKPGMDFAKIINPVIDNEDYDSSLSDEEISFLIEHIFRNIKGEKNAFMWLLGKLSSGYTDRNEINKALQNDYGERWETSEAVINTQRAGLMARMDELGLIDKTRAGINVSYCLSEAGLSLYRRGF